MLTFREFLKALFSKDFLCSLFNKNYKTEAQKRTIKAANNEKILLEVFENLGLPVPESYGTSYEYRVIDMINKLESYGNTYGKGDVRVGDLCEDYEQAARMVDNIRLIMPTLSEPVASMIEAIKYDTLMMAQGDWDESSRIQPEVWCEDTKNIFPTWYVLLDTDSDLRFNIEDCRDKKALVWIYDNELGKKTDAREWMSLYERIQVGKAIAEFIDEYKVHKAKAEREFYKDVYQGIGKQS